MPKEFHLFTSIGKNEQIYESKHDYFIVYTYFRHFIINTLVNNVLLITIYDSLNLLTCGNECNTRQ
jgi:hypothetical protein